MENIFAKIEIALILTSTNFCEHLSFSNGLDSFSKEMAKTEDYTYFVYNRNNALPI